MTYPILKFLHILGVALIGGGLIGVFVSDLRSRQLGDLQLFAESVRNIAVFYDGLVVPGALLLLASGTWLIAAFYGGWQFLQVPWLLGMVFLFLFEFIEGNTVTRLYFMRLRRLTREAVEEGQVSDELAKARAETVPSFTHFLDLPLLTVIIALGAVRPTTWTLFFVSTAIAVLVAVVLTILLPKLYPWSAEQASERST